MSLTSELRDAGSPIRAYLDGASPVLAATRGSGPVAREMAIALGLADLARQPSLVPASVEVDGGLSGTAFDIRARIALGGFDAAESASAEGIAALPGLVDPAQNGDHRNRVLAEAFQFAEELLSNTGNESDLTRASILLAYCEQIYRAGADALAGALGDQCDAASNGREFARSIPEEVLADVDALLALNSSQLDSWHDRIAAGVRFESNPSFSGARLLGGADGDWLIGDTLIDCKVYNELKVPRLRDFLRQLLGYVMLDLDDALGIRRVGVWLPRQRCLQEWTLGQLLGGDPEKLLPTLREGFVRATERSQIAVHVPVSERRKLQLLADNRHTPHAMLMMLSQGDDVDLRFRVARNTSSSMEVARRLAADRYAHVREGVGMNPAAPADLLQHLSADRSVSVRRAVAANPAWRGATAQLQIASLGEAAGGHITSANGSPGEIAHLQTISSALTNDRTIVIRQDRNPAGTPGVSLGPILRSVLFGHEAGDFDSFLPEASRCWAFRIGRSLRLPARVLQGLPTEVITDLMSDQRPAYVRRIAAEMLPVAETAVRQRLFSDLDAHIRCDALRRSVTDPDPLLGEVLAELGSSTFARLKFVTDGLEPFNTWNGISDSGAQVLELVAGHPSTPPEVLASLIVEKSTQVRLALAGNPSLTPESLARLSKKMSRTRSEEAREVLAASRSTPVVVLEGLSRDKNVTVRVAVAGNSASPEHILHSLSQDHSFDVCLAVLANTSTSSSLATSIARELLQVSENLDLYLVLKAVDHRQDLGLQKALIEDRLDLLAKSRIREPDGRLYVACNERTSRRTLERLAKSKDESVRSALAQNPRVPLKTLESLAHDQDASVRQSVACNERLTQDTLNALLLDDDLKVRLAAYGNPAMDAEAGQEQETRSAAVMLAARSTIPTVEELREMAANPRAEVRIRVAYSEHATPDILAFLGGERRSSRVRRAVAAHPKTPSTVLRSLAMRDDADILVSIAFHRETPLDVLVDLAGRSSELAVMVALNPNAPVEIVEALTRDSDEFVRFVATAQLDERSKMASPRDTTSIGTGEAQAESPIA